MWLDARIPLRLQPAPPLPAPDPDGMLLLAGSCGPEPVPGHADWGAVGHLDGVPMVPDGGHRSGCACCAGRSLLALRLSELFVRRARGELAPFRRVVLAMPAGEIGRALELLAAEPLVTARYRLDGPLG